MNQEQYESNQSTESNDTVKDAAEIADLAVRDEEQGEVKGGGLTGSRIAPPFTY